MRQIKVRKNSKNKITVSFLYDQSNKTTKIYTYVSNRKFGKIKKRINMSDMIHPNGCIDELQFGYNSKLEDIQI
ncbi:MAG: hypothetical protein QXU98_13420 [Candidatus Parvarchaeota archaeon]